MPRRSADRPAEQHVVGEHELGRQLLADRGDVRLHPVVELCAGAVGHSAHVIEPLVAIEHEHGQEPTDVRSRGDRATQVVALRVRLLREHDDVVPGPATTHARAGACRRSSRCRRAGSRARGRCACRDPARCPAVMPAGACGTSSRAPTSGQMEVERVEQLDGGVRRVHLHVARACPAGLPSS